MTRGAKFVNSLFLSHIIAIKHFSMCTCFIFQNNNPCAFFSIGASINKDVKNHVVAMVQTTSVTMYDDTPLGLSSDIGGERTYKLPSLQYNANPRHVP
jgi:hypothetical protein